MIDIRTDQEVEARRYIKPPEGFFKSTRVESISDELGPRYEYPSGWHHRGGMAKIFKGWDTRLGIPVAIKMGYLDTEPAVLKEEAERLAILDHPHIIKVLDLVPVDENGRVAMIMRYFDSDVSPTLEHLIQRAHATGKDYLKEIGVYCEQIADALTYLHEMKITHGDVKAENVIIDPNFKAILTDLGLSSDPESIDEFVQGTPFYLSPEALEGRNHETKDTWGLAVTIFHALTNKYPFGTAKDEPEEVMDKIRLGLLDLTPLSSIKLQEVFAKAFSKRESDRYETPKKFAAALQTALSG